MRLALDIETVAGSERTWRVVAGQLETRLADTSVNVKSLSDQHAAAEAARDNETARYHRLEKDLSTAISAERTARELAQAALADASVKIRELNDDREQLLEKRDDLMAAIADL